MQENILKDRQEETHIFLNQTIEQVLWQVLLKKYINILFLETGCPGLSSFSSYWLMKVREELGESEGASQVLFSPCSWYIYILSFTSIKGYFFPKELFYAWHNIKPQHPVNNILFWQGAHYRVTPLLNRCTCQKVFSYLKLNSTSWS